MSKINFSVDAIFLFGKWNLKTKNEDCGICRTSLTLPPQGSNTIETDVVEGRCGHAFHNKCIERWKSEGFKSKKNTSCPTDGSEFIVVAHYTHDPNWINTIPRVPSS